MVGTKIQMNEEDIVKVSSEEFRAAYKRRLKVLGITEEELLRQAADGNFKSHQIKGLWFAVGAWKNGKPYVNI